MNKVSEEVFKDLNEARNVLCNYCENHDACDCCQVTLLMDQAYVECSKASECE